MNERPRILAVDDKPENIRLLEAILVPAGYDVVGANSGQDALAKAREASFDMILTDVVMPGMSGYELCRALRKDPTTAFLPIVTITASGGEEKKEALDAGADDYVAKPFDKTELVARVRSLLRVKAYHDDLQRALDRQTAIGEVLRAIGSSAFQLEPVLEAVAKHAARLCDARDVIFWRTVGDSYVLALAPQSSADPVGRVLGQIMDNRPMPIGPDTIVGRAHLERRPVQVPDIAEYYRGATGRAADLAQLGGVKTLLAVPLIRDDRVLGVISLVRPEIRPFSDDEIDLVRTFADQAAIAIANVDLFGTVERQREELSRFLSPQVAALITSEEGAKMLEGHRRAITVVSCDMRGSTAFVEMAEPEEALGVMREYHRAMGELIVAHHGVLEHFAGDGFMVFFNDPLPLENHELQAVQMAVAMRQRFNELTAGWRKRGYDLDFGVGIAVGYATLGRIGFEGRYDYGAVGNVVILASRLASEAKGGQILLSQRVHAAVESNVEVESIGDLTLKGMSRPVPAVNVMALRAVPA